MLHPCAPRSLFCDCQPSSAKTLPKAVKGKVQEPERKCRVVDIASRREAAVAGSIAAHEKNRQLIDQNRQVIEQNRPLVRAEKGATMLQGGLTVSQGVRPVSDVAAPARELDWLGDRPAPGPTPEQAAIQNEHRQRLLVALRALSERERAVGKMRTRLGEEEARRA